MIDDEMLDAFAIVAEPGDVPARIADRFGGSLDRLQFYAGVSDADLWGADPHRDQVDLNSPCHRHRPARDGSTRPDSLSAPLGAIAQLVERFHGMEEVRGFNSP